MKKGVGGGVINGTKEGSGAGMKPDKTGGKMFGFLVTVGYIKAVEVRCARLGVGAEDETIHQSSPSKEN